jgi:exodeoxyribonuclease VII large subunit
MAEPAPRTEPPHVFTVSTLTGAVRDLLGDALGEVWVRGEISQWRPAASGHVYFTIKDDGAVMPCVMWRNAAQRLRFKPDEGLEVLIGGGLDVYPPHGKYQLQVRTLEPLGAGALQQAFEKMRKRLEAEGLFAPERKVPLPHMPRRIALVTSPKGAAVRDLVTVIHRRFPHAVLLLVSVRVQGAGSAEEIARGLAFADLHADADVIVVGRGGGSLEDLWAFNEEVVARAIFACVTPVISAVGHETDVTIADLVADVRAATPSQAGELVVPVLTELRARLEGEQVRLTHRLRVRLDRAWQRLEALAERPALRDARVLLGPRRRILDHAAQRLAAVSPRAALERRREHLSDLGCRLHPPLQRRLLMLREHVKGLAGRAGLAVRRRVERAHARLLALDQGLRALSPLSVLGRGYSLTYGPDGRLVRRAADVRAGDGLWTRLADGAEVGSRVERVEPPATTGTAT